MPPISQSAVKYDDINDLLRAVFNSGWASVVVPNDVILHRDQYFIATDTFLHFRW